MHCDLPIGLFDSGVGGLTVAAAVKAALPDEEILYFGDTARCPYGVRSSAEVLQFSLEVCDFLVGKGVKMLVVACNTATAAALPVLERRYDIPVIGVVRPGARAAVRASARGRIGVIGTGVTVHTGVYERAIRMISPNSDVFSLACPEFVVLVERGETSGEHVFAVVCERLQPLQASDIDTLILGCTHYPHLQPIIERVMGPSVRLISSAEETACEVTEVLRGRNWLRRPTGQRHDTFYTTGDGIQMRAALLDWMGIEPRAVDLQTVDLQALTIHV